MKKSIYSVLIMSIFASCLVACGGKSTGHNNDSDAMNTVKQDSIEAIKEIQTRVEEIYRDVFNYGNHEGLYDPDEKYMTSEYREMLLKAMDIVGGVVIDCDHWSQSQDPTKPFMKILSVEKTSETSAVVEIFVSDSINTSPRDNVRLILVKENGAWLVDDFITHLEDEGQEYSEKADLKKIISSAAGNDSPIANSDAVIADYFESKVYSGEYIFDVVLTDAALNKEKCVFRMKIEGDRVSIYDEGYNLHLKGSINDELQIEVDYDAGDDMHHYSLTLSPNDREGLEWTGEYQYTAWVKTVGLKLKECKQKGKSVKITKKK